MPTKNYFENLPDSLTAEEKRQRLDAVAYHKIEDFYLESAELFELRYNLKERLLADEVKYFEEWGCSLIYVS